MLPPAFPTVDPALLSHAQRLTLLERLAAEEAALHALRARTLAAVEIADRSEKHWDRDEVAAVLRVAATTARTQLVDAERLVSALPATLSYLESGAISWAHARVLLDGVRGLDEASTAAVEAYALQRIADGRARTPAQFRPVVARAVARADTRRFARKHLDAVTQRRISWRANTADGTTDLYALGLPADEAAHLIATLDQAARTSAVLPDGTRDPRTAEQRRADALLDLGRSAAPGTGGPAVSVHVAASTLLGLDDLPAHLDGHGPIPAPVVRAIAEDPRGSWRRILTDRAGLPIDVSTAYRPPARLRRLVERRDRTCRFPGCRRQATTCELDHVRAWNEGGQTGAANLQALCARHHHLKHEGPGWRVARLPDGTTRWRSPTGRIIDVPLDRDVDVPRSWRSADLPDRDWSATIGGFHPDAPPFLTEPPDLDDRDLLAA